MSYRISRVQRSTVPRKRRLNKRRFLRARGKKGNKTRATREMITFMSPKQMPYPQRYRTKFTTSVQGNLATTGAAKINGQFFVRLNNPSQPFNDSQLDGTVNVYANFLPATATLQPAGLTSMFNTNQYQKMRVYSSRIEVNFIPLAISDPINVTITPSLNNATPALASSALEQPYTKQCVFDASRSRSKLSNYITQHTLIGCTKRAVEDDLSDKFTVTTGSTPGIPLYWVVNWSMVDNVAFSANILVVIKVIHYVEMFANYDAAMPET